MAPEVWYAIPSANPENCRRVLPQWRERGYRIAVLQNADARAEVPADVVIEVDAYDGWGAAVNDLCRRAVPEDVPIIVTGGDDVLPDPDHTAAELGARFLERFPDTFGVMQPHGDEYMNARYYCGSPWLGRAWIQEMNGGRGPIWPGYRHNWADYELLQVARGLDALWARRDLVQHHEHFSRTGEDAPAYWRHAVEAHDRRDVELFLSRFALGFPGHEPTSPRAALDTERLHRESAGLAERYWLTHYGCHEVAGGEPLRLLDALTRCRDAGYARVGLFGAGTFTKAAGSALRSPPVDVACIIDDRRDLAGTRLWNYPIVPRAQAIGMELDAVVLCCLPPNETMITRSDEFRARGVAVLRVDAEDDLPFTKTLAGAVS